MTYRLQDVFTAIADPNRRRILAYLAHSDLSVNSIVERFPMSRTAVSKHLKVLYRSNLVEIKQQGRKRIYKLNAQPLNEVSDWVAQYETFWNESLKRLKRQVEEKT